MKWIFKQGTVLGALAKLRKAIISSIMLTYLSVRMQQFGPHWTDFYKTWHLNFLRQSVENIQFSLKSDKNNGHFSEDVFTFMIISRWILLRMRNVLDKSCRENQNTHFTFSNFFPDWLEIELFLGNGPRTQCCQAIGVDKEEEEYSFPKTVPFKKHFRKMSWSQTGRIRVAHAG
jgi:hypothetical protein